MYIRNILSYGDSWSILNEKYSSELEDIVSVLKDITIQNINDTEMNERFGNNPMRRFRTCWENAIEEKKWIRSDISIDTEFRRKFSMRLLGHISNKISINFMFHRESTNRWIYTTTPMAHKNSIISLPIAICVLRDSSTELYNNRHSSMGADFEYIKEELSALSPLSHTTPFLILGVSINDGNIDVLEIKSEIEMTQQATVINRSIEFPAEYHQAGLGILNYFGTVIREKYPEQNAKVKIEQDGLIVRMIIETEDGNQETIEKALKEYEMVLRGEKPIDELFESKLQVLAMKSELRIAEVRLETARDLIEFKTNEVKTLKELFGHVLTNKTSDPVINVNVSPTIQITNDLKNTMVIKHDAIAINQDLEELLCIGGITPDVEMKLIDLTESIDNITNEDNKDKVKNSSALHKLKSFIEDAQNTNESLNKFITASSNGIDKLQSIGEKYNSIAEWCGVPVIPKFFLKES